MGTSSGVSPYKAYECAWVSQHFLTTSAPVMKLRQYRCNYRQKKAPYDIWNACIARPPSLTFSSDSSIERTHIYDALQRYFEHRLALQSHRMRNVLRYELRTLYLSSRKRSPCPPPCALPLCRCYTPHLRSSFTCSLTAWPTLPKEHPPEPATYLHGVLARNCSPLLPPMSTVLSGWLPKKLLRVLTRRGL